jgi:hypothetical protein
MTHIAKKYHVDTTERIEMNQLHRQHDKRLTYEAAVVVANNALQTRLSANIYIYIYRTEFTPFTKYTATTDGNYDSFFQKKS